MGNNLFCLIRGLKLLSDVKRQQLLWKESLNSDGQQFHQYQPSPQLIKHEKDHYKCRWKSRSWPGI